MDFVDFFPELLILFGKAKYSSPYFVTFVKLAFLFRVFQDMPSYV